MHWPVHGLLQHTPSTHAPEAQAAALVQAVPLLARQLPVPSQAWPSAQLPATVVPALAATQVPSDPATLHALHGPLQVELPQHTPSTQYPLAHEAAKAAVQPSPLPRPVTVYSQVSSVVLIAPFALLDEPLKRTTTSRPLSKAMAEL